MSAKFRLAIAISQAERELALARLARQQEAAAAGRVIDVPDDDEADSPIAVAPSARPGPALRSMAEARDGVSVGEESQSASSPSRPVWRSKRNQPNNE